VKTLDSLLAAKQALMAYAVNYADNYGHNTRGGTGRLPCPALDRFSSPATRCSANSIGYLPSVWLRDGQLMEIDYLERFLKQDIWYAVSTDHRFNPAFNHLSPVRGTGLLTVDSDQDVVAVLIAPGVSGVNQSRESNGQSIAQLLDEYLEGENADQDGVFTLTERLDILVPIRRNELMPLMERRVLGYVKQWLQEYKEQFGYYPYASEVGANGACRTGLLSGFLATEPNGCEEVLITDVHYPDIPRGRQLKETWFHRYGWSNFFYYIVDPNCGPTQGVTDCDGVDDPTRTLTVNGEPVEVLIVSVGETLETSSGMQVRPSANLADYIETTSIEPGTNDFTISWVFPTRNVNCAFDHGVVTWIYDETDGSTSFGSTATCHS